VRFPRYNDSELSVIRRAMMDYSKTAIAFGNTKEAALYFDHVIPISLAVDTLPEFVHTLRIKKWPPETSDLVPENLRRNIDFVRQFEDLNMATFYVLYKLISEKVGKPPELEGMTAESWAEVDDKAEAAYSRFLEKFALRQVPVASAGSAIAESDSTADDVALTISSLRLVDVSKTSWEQLVAFRKDPEAKQKLRRLRLFAAENYAGKGRSFIEDDLNRRIYDYEEEARRWSFETKQAVVTMLLTSKTLASTMSGSVISALFGASAVAIASAIGGAGIEIGRIAIEVSRRRFALRNALRENPISYIKDAEGLVAE
jgi:hypothetical protein